jgi:hypothetical protein
MIVVEYIFYYESNYIEFLRNSTKFESCMPYKNKETICGKSKTKANMSNTCKKKVFGLQLLSGVSFLEPK